MTQSSKALMLFAAGFGTRMRELTRDRPKPLIKVAGRALIDRALDLVKAHGVARIVVNLHYKADMLRRHLDGENTLFSVESPEILDTGGGLKKALPLLESDPVFTMNPDTIWLGANPLDLLAAAWRPGDMDALLRCVPLENAIGRTGGGDFSLDSKGHLSRTGRYVYCGLQILKTEPVKRAKGSVFSLNETWDDLARNQRLFGLAYPGKWCDVGSPEGLKQAEKQLLESDV